MVITPSDPMTQNITLDDLDDVAKEEVQTYKNKVIVVTQGLKVHFKNWTEWENLWESICLDVELLNLLKQKSPRNNSWGINQKMICNVIGIYVGVKMIEVAVSTLNNALGGRNFRSYISDHCAYGTSNTVLTKSQYEKIKMMMH